MATFTPADLFNAVDVLVDEVSELAALVQAQVEDDASDVVASEVIPEVPCDLHSGLRLEECFASPCLKGIRRV